jgi:hypothetical protein
MEARRRHGHNLGPVGGRRSCPDGDQFEEETNSSNTDAVRDVGSFNDSDSIGEDIGDSNAAADERVQEVQARRVRDHERKRRSRRQMREDQEDYQRLIEEEMYEYQNHEIVNIRAVKDIARLCVAYVSQCLLESGLGPLGRERVLESFLDYSLIHPHLPSYYFRLQDHKICAAVIGNICEELDQVKSVHFAEKLAYKSALLNCVVGAGISTGQVSTYSRFLSTHPLNLKKASQRRVVVVEEGGSLWKLWTRKHWPGFSAATIQSIVDWWTSKTRMSPNKKDVVNKRIWPHEKE